MATFFDGRCSFKDVDVGADGGINTSQFLEAAEGVVQLFGKGFYSSEMQRNAEGELAH